MLRSELKHCAAFSLSLGDGITVIRLPINLSIVLLKQLINQLLNALEKTLSYYYRNAVIKSLFAEKCYKV